MNANAFSQKDYENETTFRPKKTNPNKPNFKPSINAVRTVLTAKIVLPKTTSTVRFNTLFLKSPKVYRYILRSQPFGMPVKKQHITASSMSSSRNPPACGYILALGGRQMSRGPHIASIISRVVGLSDYMSPRTILIIGEVNSTCSIGAGG